MIAGMAGFVVYDFLEPRGAKASTESGEPTVEEAAPPAHTTPERKPSRPSRFSKSTRAPAPARAPVHHDDSEPEEEIATNAVAPTNPAERAPRSFLGSPMGRMRPGGMGLRPASNQPPPVRFVPQPEPEPEPEPPPPAEPPPEQPAETVEQPSEQPAEQPTEQPEQPTEQPTDQPAEQPTDQPTDQPAEQPTDQPEQPTDQPEQVEPVR